jgi:hypothetical protein
MIDQDFTLKNRLQKELLFQKNAVIMVGEKLLFIQLFCLMNLIQINFI